MKAPLHFRPLTLKFSKTLTATRCIWLFIFGTAASERCPGLPPVPGSKPNFNLAAPHRQQVAFADHQIGIFIGFQRTGATNTQYFSRIEVSRRGILIAWYCTLCPASRATGVAYRPSCLPAA